MISYYRQHGYIYVIENDINDKLYVGRTLDLKKRQRVHFSNSSRTWAIKAAIEKYGSEHFDFVVLETCASEEELNIRESYWIKTLDTLAPFGYNLKEGGKSGKPSEAVREKLSVAHKGVKLSIEHKQAIGKSLIGRTVSDKTRQKISKSHIGLCHSKESRNKISKAHKGKSHSLETRRRISESQKGKHHDSPSDDTRKRISIALSGRTLSFEHRQKISQALQGNQNAKR